MTVTAYDVAQRFIGVQEVTGVADNPLIIAMLRLEDGGAQHDEVAWCSAFVNFVAWLLRLPRSKSLAARSWLTIGRPIDLAAADADSDIVVLARGADPQPGADVVNAPGHVGFYAGVEGDTVLVLGGNQGDRVCVERFPLTRVLGVRRLT